MALAFLSSSVLEEDFSLGVWSVLGQLLSSSTGKGLSEGLYCCRVLLYCCKVLLYCCKVLL